MADFCDFTELFKLDAISSSGSYACYQNESALFSSSFILSFSDYIIHSMFNTMWNEL